MPEDQKTTLDREAEYAAIREAEDAAMDELLELFDKTTKELDEETRLEVKQELTIKRLDEILNWNLEHGHFETLFPIFEEFITYLPESKLNEFFQSLKKFSTLRVQ